MQDWLNQKDTAEKTRANAEQFLHDILVDKGQDYADRSRPMFPDFQREYQQLRRNRTAVGPTLILLNECLNDTKQKLLRQLVVASFKVCCQDIVKYHSQSLELLEFCAEICPSEITNSMIEELSKVPDEPAGHEMRKFYLQLYRSILRRTKMEEALKVLEAALASNK